MDVVIEGTNNFIKLDNLQRVGSGKDGKLFKYGNSVIKICESGYMTYEIFYDMKDALVKLREKGIDASKTSIVLPEKKVYNPYSSQVSNLRVTPLFGYTQRYILCSQRNYVNLSTSDFIKMSENLHKDVHEIFTLNSIALIDTNPHNIIFGKDNRLYLIDHDRCITKRCTEIEKQCVKSNDYFSHNEERFTTLINKFLLYQIVAYIKEKKEEEQSDIKRMIDKEFSKGYSANDIFNSINFNIEKLLKKSKTIDDVYHSLDGFDSVEQYAKSNAKRLIKVK